MEEDNTCAVAVKGGRRNLVRNLIVLSLTPRFSRVLQRHAGQNRCSDYLQPVETVENGFDLPEPLHTQLKQGVNENEILMNPQFLPA